MLCPFCLSSQTVVYNSRKTVDGMRLWRRRQCLECKNSFTTYEKPELKHLKVNGKPYHRIKLTRSIMLVFTKPAEAIRYTEDVVSIIEHKLIRQLNTDISAEKMIEIVLESLRPISRTAYLVYLAKHEPAMSKKQLNSLSKS